MKVLKRQLHFLFTLALLLLIASCGGGGGGIGGGLIPAFQTFNVNALLPNTTVDLNDYLDEAAGPYTITIISGPGTIDSNGNILANAGADFDVIIVGITDSKGNFIKVRIPIIGHPINWLQAESVTTSQVATWPDSSGNGFAIGDCLTDACPTLSANQLNGKKLVAFDGINDRMSFSATGFRNDHTAFVLFKSENGAESGLDWFQKSALISSYDGDVGDYDFGMGFDASGRVFAGYRHFGGTTNFNSITAHNDGKGHIAVVTRDQTSGNFWHHLDGIEKWAAGPITSPLTGIPAVYFSIGAQHDGSNFFEGDIGEIILYDKSLSDTQRQVVERYLVDKFEVEVPDTFTPTVTINSVPADPTDNNLIFGYTATPSPLFDIVKIECHLDGSWRPCNTKTAADYFGLSSIVDTVQYNAVADGTYTFEIRVTDSDGRTASDTHTLSVDSNPPICTISFPINGSYVADAAPTATFSCSDNSAITSYKCDINDADTWNDCTSNTTQTLSGLTTDDVTKLEVKARDQYGLWSAVATTTWTTDLTDPTCAFTTTPNLIQDGGSANFIYSCSDNNPFPSGVECSIDGGLFIPCGSDTNLDLTGLAAGSHSLVIRVTDVAGTIITESHNWTTDLSAPSCQFDPLFGGTGYDDDNAPTLTFSCSDDNPFTNNVQCRLDGAAASDCTSSTSQTLAALVEGNHTLEISITDIAGKSASESFSWGVDLSAPSCSFTSQESGTVGSPLAHFEFSCVDPTSGGISSGLDKVECSLDGGPYSDCDGFSLHDLVGLADGAHSLRVQPIDLAGNIGAFIEANWSVLASPPTVASNYSDNTYPCSVFLDLAASKPASIYYCISSISSCDPESSGILYVNPVETVGANATYNISYYAIDGTSQKSLVYSQNFVISRFEFAAESSTGALTINGNGIRELSGSLTTSGFFRDAGSLGAAFVKGTSQSSVTGTLLEQGFNEIIQ